MRACIALSGPFDLADAWDGLPELTQEAFRVRSHCATEADAKRNAATLSLKGVASRIVCPLFVVVGKQDRVIPWQDAERLAREAKGPVELVMTHRASDERAWWKQVGIDPVKAARRLWRRRNTRPSDGTLQPNLRTAPAGPDAASSPDDAIGQAPA